MTELSLARRAELALDRAREARGARTARTAAEEISLAIALANLALVEQMARIGDTLRELHVEQTLRQTDALAAIAEILETKTIRVVRTDQ